MKPLKTNLTEHNQEPAIPMPSNQPPLHDPIRALAKITLKRPPQFRIKLPSKLPRILSHLPQVLEPPYAFVEVEILPEYNQEPPQPSKWRDYDIDQVLGALKHEELKRIYENDRLREFIVDKIKNIDGRRLQRLTTHIIKREYFMLDLELRVILKAHKMI